MLKCNHPSKLEEYWIETVMLGPHSKGVDAYALPQNFVKECQHMSGMAKSLFYKSNLKKQVRVRYYYELI